MWSNLILHNRDARRRKWQKIVEKCHFLEPEMSNSDCSFCLINSAKCKDIHFYSDVKQRKEANPCIRQAAAKECLLFCLINDLIALSKSTPRQDIQLLRHEIKIFRLVKRASFGSSFKEKIEEDKQKVTY